MGRMGCITILPIKIYKKMSSGIEEDDTIQREKKKNREEEEKKNKQEADETKAQPKETPKRNSGIECRYFTLSTVTMIVMAGAGILHMFSWLDVGTELGLYDVRRDATWERYDAYALKYLVEDDKIFWTWIVVYALQIIWIASGIILIFQKTKKGRYLYTQVTLLPLAIHVFMMFAAAAIFGWVFLWNKYDYMRYSIACVAGGTLFSYTALIASMLACRTAEPWLVIQDKTGVLILVGLLVQNGLAAFASMSSIMTNYHLSIILSEEANISPAVTAYISFGLNIIFLGVYFIIDTCLSDRHAQCVVTPYLLVSVSFIGSYFKIINQSDQEKEKEEYDLLWILSLVGAGAAALMLLVKIVVSVMRAYNRKIHDRRIMEERRKNLPPGNNDKV